MFLTGTSCALLANEWILIQVLGVISFCMHIFSNADAVKVTSNENTLIMN